MKRAGGWIALGLVLAVCGSGVLRVTLAAEGDEPAPPAAKKPASTDPDIQKLEKLVAESRVLGEKLQKLQQAFQTADDKEKPKIRAEFEQHANKLFKELFPKMVAAALPVYLKDGSHKDAEGIVLQHVKDLLDENKFNEVIAQGNKLIAADRKHPAVLNFVGIAHYANNDFAKAQKQLTEAQAADEEIFTQLGARFFDTIPDYVGYWKKEQELRAKEAKAAPGKENPRVLLKTTKGDIEIELFEDQAPNTVANFINLVENKKYDGIAFHRVIPNFMAQGGDPNTLDDDPRNDGRGGPGYHIVCECDRKDARMHFQGTLSMAHGGRDTGGSQFFLTYLPTAHLNGKHTAFGRVVKGFEVAAGLKPGEPPPPPADKIVSAKVIRKRDHKYEPVTIPGE